MKKFMLLFCVFALTACEGDSGHGSDDKRPEELVTTLSALQNQNSLPGLAAAIIKDDEMNAGYVGTKKIGSNLPLNSESVFHLGSCTKAMTATLAAILIEEGLFQWDSLISDLLPNVDMHEGFEDATFEMLLSHRSGLATDGPENFSNDWLFKALQNILNTSTQARKLYVSVIFKLPPRTAPGSTFYYSNGGYMIAASIMEKLTGKSWETLIREKIFNPLSMKTCSFGATWGHYRSGTVTKAIFADNPIALAPAAGVYCTLSDWGKFLSMHLNEDKLLTQESFNKLHTVSANDGQNYTYGGWIKVYRSWANGTVLTHNGSNTWNYAQVYLVPHSKTILMSTTNIAGPEAVKATDEAIRQLIKTGL